MRRVWRAGSWLLCVALLLPASWPAWAQSDIYHREVREQLMTSALSFMEAGFELSHDPLVDVLEQGQKFSIRLELYGNVPYAMIGVCDRDCYQMDLVLYDENWQQIDADRRRDDYPVVQVTPAWTGRFYLVVTIPACVARDCVFGVGVFAR